MSFDKDFFTKKEAADYIGQSTRTINRMLARRELSRFGVSRIVLISKAELVRVIHASKHVEAEYGRIAISKRNRRVS